MITYSYAYIYDIYTYMYILIHTQIITIASKLKDIDTAYMSNMYKLFLQIRKDTDIGFHVDIVESLSMNG